MPGTKSHTLCRAVRELPRGDDAAAHGSCMPRSTGWYSLPPCHLITLTLTLPSASRSSASPSPSPSPSPPLTLTFILAVALTLGFLSCRA